MVTEVGKKKTKSSSASSKTPSSSKSSAIGSKAGLKSKTKPVKVKKSSAPSLKGLSAKTSKVKTTPAKPSAVKGQKITKSPIKAPVKTASKAPSKGAIKSSSREKMAIEKPKAKPSTPKTAPSSSKVTRAMPENKSQTAAKSIASVKSVKVPTELSPKTPMLSGDSMMPYKFEPYNPTSKEDYMSDQQLHHFRNILETWKKELMKEVDNTITEMKGASVLADPNDRATQEETFNLELRTRDRERKLIRKIEEALKQIDDKEYGYCESCGVEIGIRRLEARPTAALCIDCKTLDEIRERTTQ